MTAPASPLVEIFGPASSAQLIVYLVFNHGNEFTLADVAERLKISKPKVNKMKDGLIKYKIIHETRKVGKTSYYRYDRNSKMGKLIYELVFNAGAAEHPVHVTHPVTPVTHVTHVIHTPTPPPAPPRKDKDDGGGKIIIAS